MPATPPPRRDPRPTRVIVALLLALLLVGAVAWGIRQVDDFVSRRDVSTADAGARQMPIAIKTGVLELSTIRSPRETFVRTDSQTFLGGINLGTTVSEVEVDAVFRYHVPTDPNGWNVRRVGDAFRVIVPAVKPSLPVAFDTATLRKKTISGWARFNKDENLAALEKAVTGELGRKAASPAYIEFQRQAAREAAREFVVRWFIRQERWKDVRPDQVRVFFADEPISRLDVWKTQF